MRSVGWLLDVIMGRAGLVVLCILGKIEKRPSITVVSHFGNVAVF